MSYIHVHQPLSHCNVEIINISIFMIEQVMRTLINTVILVQFTEDWTQACDAVY